MNRKTRTWMAVGLAVVAVAGCERTPPDVAALREGTRLELKGDWSGAEGKYLEACGAGNGEAFRKLAEMLLKHEGTRVFLEAKRRDADWVYRARALLERIEMVSGQAAAQDCPVEDAAKTLAAYRKTIEETEARIEKERAEKEERIARERAAIEEAARRKAEEQRRAEAELAARRTAEAEAAARRAEEEKRRNSPEYCIENGLELSQSAFREVCRAMNYRQNTGNTLVDNQAESEQHARFRGQRVKVTGKITKVDSKLLGGVKIKLNVYGESVWANFPSMSQSEGMDFRVGETLRVEGKVDSAMINPFNLGQCSMW